MTHPTPPPVPAAGRPRPARGPWIVVTVALALLAVIATLAWNRARFAERQALESESTKNDNLALAHAETLERELQTVDLLLQAVRDDHLRGRNAPTLAERMRQFGPALGGPVVVSVLDAQGRVVATTAASSNATFADRDYFRTHAADPEDRLLVGQPNVGRLSSRWVVPMTRRVAAADGRFAGVVYAGVDPAWLARLYERSALGPRGSLALIGLDGVTRVRRNGERVIFGGDVSGSRLFSELPRNRHGRYIAEAASDGVRRTVSFRQLDGFPLVVVVASSLDDVFASAGDAVRSTWAAAGVAGLLVLSLAAAAALWQWRQQRALARTAEAERRIRLLLDNSFDAILQTRPDGGVLAANAAACRLFGADEAALCALGREGLVDPADPRLAALLAERQRHGRASGRLRMRRADGHVFEAEVSSIVYTDADGRRASSMTVRDLTEQLAAEAARSRIEQRLRQSQKLESIGTLAGGIAHDFNNILASILGNAALLRDDAGPVRPGSEPLERIHQAALRARMLVQQILTFSRRGPEQRRAQPLQPLLRESAALLRATLPAAVQLELALPETSLVARCDGTQVQQVLMNLCTNAWQAMPERRGRIEVTLAAEAGEGGRWAVLRVRDDGTGIDEATRARLFEPFFTTKPLGEGTGLGLSVVHGIVAAHGGSIAVDSAPGTGATFTVRLPLLDEAEAEPAAHEATEAPRGRDEHVLYVDDDAVLGVTVEQLLRRGGWRATVCAGAAEALQRVRADPAAFDLVVTDYNMPGLSGLDLAAELAALRPGLPVVITSGYVSDELLARAQAAGVRRVLFKEYTLEQLPALVRELLSG